MEPAEDYELWSRIVFMGEIVNLPEVLLYYRIHNNQTSKLRNEKQRFVAEYIKRNMLEKVFFTANKVFNKNTHTINDLIEYKKYIKNLQKNNKLKVVYDINKFEEFLNREKKSIDLFYYNNLKFPSFNLLKMCLLNFNFFNNIGFKRNIKLMLKLFLNLFGYKIRKKIRYGFYKLIEFKKNIFYFIYTKMNSYKKMNYYEIPIIIISYNQLNYLKLLIEFLQISGYNNIVIIDNNSSYIPLLEYFEDIKKNVTIHKLDDNFGHKVFWKFTKFQKLYAENYFVLTDPDIIPDKDCPKDFLFYFLKRLNENKFATKVGFSLVTSDIPDCNIDKKVIIEWEKQFQLNKNNDGDFIANIDTTFALYKPFRFISNNNFYKAIRTKHPYLARHGGWYIDQKSLTEEQKFYIETANSSSSWLYKESKLKN
jgi:hypothetical protein